MEKPYRARYLNLWVFPFLLLFAASAFGRSYVGGVAYTRDGQRIEVQQFLDPLKKDNFIIGQSENKQVRVPVGELKELNLLTSGVNYIFQHSKLVQETGTVSLVYRDGRAAILTNAYFEKGSLLYVVLTAKGKREERKAPFKSLLKIQFETTVGTVRVCPLDKAVFPDDFVFCPYHGVPLVWGSPKP
ncbi:MAG: hypothetical protein M1377_01100 [Deltaproteobacteria bacterium]|nr:hypothetical protein [Deltaproteobacteria bacterium]